MCLAVPGRIVSLTGDDPVTRMAKVSFGGVLKEVSLAFLPEAQVDEYVIVHAGFALSRIDEHEARQLFEDLKQLAGDDLADAELGGDQEPMP
ncbi:MAG TPA: HypC/HybG/HupF family hydrogenase formation chaperone [Vicinamibacterales bacterium]|jgi:hydrogenase expression/formation protein HypC